MALSWGEMSQWAMLLEDIASGDNAPYNGNIAGGDITLVAGRHCRLGICETAVQDSGARQKGKTAVQDSHARQDSSGRQWPKRAAQEGSSWGAGRVEENGREGGGREWWGVKVKTDQGPILVCWQH